MACFLAPASVAILTTGLRKKIAPKYHLEWLNALLWGGSLMLAVEHIAHEEIIPYPPFLSAIQNPSQIPGMLKEIATLGTTMTIAIFLVWGAMILVANKVARINERKIVCG